MNDEIIPFDKRRSVLQDWVHKLTFMQQSVLITAVRGPDGIRKDHDVKVLCRWLRRCFLISAFERKVLEDPYKKGGGSFTGPALGNIDDYMDKYLRTIDELPHHFQLHLMHAAEVLGYKHPKHIIAMWWKKFYFKIVNDAHLFPETEKQMDKRLGDFEDHWKEREEVTAK